MKTNDWILNGVNIKKRYRNNVVFDSLNIEFKRGFCYMIIGKNGCGKSTLIKTLLNINSINGGAIYRNYNNVGYVPEKGILPSHLTVCEFLYELSRLRRISNIDSKIKEELIKWEINDKANIRINSLSKGMVQKVLIIQALLVDADLLVFDEVLNGLDQKMQGQLFDCIDCFKKKNKTIIIISHYPKSYERVVDIIYEITDGEIKNVYSLNQVSS